MAQVAEATRYLDNLVRKHNWFLDPFSCERLSLTAHSVKVVLTLESQELETRQSVEVTEDSLLPVFYSIASKLFPSGFDFRSNRRVHIVGGPACGKTTLLKHMAVLCSTQQQFDKRKANSARLTAPFVPIIAPVRLLTELIEAKGLGSDENVLDYFLVQKYRRDYAQLTFLRNAVLSGRFWLLLDGLNEAGTPQSLNVLVEYLEKLLETLPNLRVVVTSRDGFSGKARLAKAGFCALRMRPLTTELAETIVAQRLAGNPASTFFSKPTLPEWLKSELRRPAFKLFRKSPMTLMLLVNVLQDLDKECKGNVPTPAHCALLASPKSAHPVHYKELSPEEEEAIKKSCQGHDLMPPFSRIELFKRAILRLLKWRPVEQENKTTCTSPLQRGASDHERPTSVLQDVSGLESESKAMSAFKIEIPSISFNCHLPTCRPETDAKLMQLLRVLAYQAHERQSREIKLREMTDILETIEDSDGDLVAAVQSLIGRITDDEAPLFTIEDRDDYIEEETLEQQQHQQPRESRLPTEAPEELREKGLTLFLHQSIQEHLTAEYIAEIFLSTVEKESKLGTERALQENDSAAGASLSSTLASKGGNLIENQEEDEYEAEQKEQPAQSTKAPARYSVLRSRRSRSVMTASSSKSPKVVLTPRTPRRASVVGAGHFKAGVDYSDTVLQQKLRDLVERYMLGHFETSRYRVALDWWQPLLLTVFDLIAENAIPPHQQNGATLFDTVLRLLVDCCTRMHTYNNGRAPICVESFWLSAASFGNVRVARGMMKLLGVRSMLQAVNDDWNNAMHLAAVNNQPEIIKLLMAEDEVDSEYLDRNNRHGWDPSNMAMVFNHTHCFRLLCCTDGDKVAENDARDRRPPLVDAAMKGDLQRTQDILNGVDLDSDPEFDDVDGDDVGEEDDDTEEYEHRDFDSDEEYDEHGRFRGRMRDETGIPARVRSRRVSHRRANSRGSGGDKENARSGNRQEVLKQSRKRSVENNNRRRGIGSLCSSVYGLAKRKPGYGKAGSKSLCDINAKGSSGMTALMWAARNGHAEIVAELIKHGANIKETAQGISALIFAVESGHVDCVKILIENGADPLSRTPDDDSSLLCSCSFGYDEVAKVLIEAGASALEALVVSCVQGKDSTVRSLVENGLVNVNEVWNDLMVTPLAGACVAGHLSTVRLLLALGADPNVPIDVEYGSTPLMLACHMGNIEVVQVMLDAGSDPNARTPPSSQCAQANGPNTTAVSVARLNGHQDVERLLRSYGAREYVPVDLTFYEWLGGHVHLPLLSPDFEARRRLGTEVTTLIDEDEYFARVDLFAWQWLGGRTAGERAWEPRQ